MEFNKCSRCGNFFMANDDVCPRCKAKDNLEFGTFKNYIQENGIDTNLDNLSSATGISVKNISRFINYTTNETQNGNIKL